MPIVMYNLLQIKTFKINIRTFLFMCESIDWSVYFSTDNQNEDFLA